MNVQEIVSQLSAGGSVRFNQRFVSPDLADGIVWGTDEYGRDVLAARSAGPQDDYLKRAAEWMLAESKETHPAEFCW